VDLLVLKEVYFGWIHGAMAGRSQNDAIDVGTFAQAVIQRPSGDLEAK
jgi:hypothetical protein